jgi:NADH:ubiquinone oxidoreductase subunit 5 (subunit L)/multisubunit Na+/H+ antiporter MnhA subunit
MTVALSGLAFLGIFGGHLWLNGDFLGHHTWFETLVTPARLYGGQVAGAVFHEVAPAVEHAAHTLALTVSLAVALLGIGLAVLLYLVRPSWPARIARGLGEVYHLVANKYYIDEFVNATVIRATLELSALQRWLDENLVDGLVNGAGVLNRQLGFFAAAFDRTVVDGAVNGVALVTQAFGSVARLLQTGRIQQYVSFAVAGGLAAAAWLILS